MDERYDIMVWTERCGWEAVRRALRLAAAEIAADALERRYGGGKVSICRSLWADVPESLWPVS
jgi:hypothetical protein